MKSARQIKILEIVKNKNIETQNQLIDELHKAGFSSTQATISRDIKELRLVKELTVDGAYKYVYSSGASENNHSERLRTIFHESVINVDYAQNIIVLKTLPGLAPAACSAIDAMNFEGKVGSLAGDDTAMIIMRDNDSAVKISEEISSFL